MTRATRPVLKATTKTEAEAESLSFENSGNTNVVGARQEVYTLKQAFADAWESENWKAKRGTKNTSRHCQDILELLGSNRPLASIAYDDMEKLKAAVLADGASSNTVNQKLNPLSFVLRRPLRPARSAILLASNS